MNKKSMIVTLAVTIALLGYLSVNTQQVSAIGGFLKKIKPAGTEQKQTQEAQPEKQDTKAVSQSSEPIEYKNDKYYYTFKYPGNWDVRDTDPKKSNVDITDTNGQLGTFIVTSTWMSSDFPVEPAVQALLKQAQERKAHGELESFEVKNVDGARGVLWIESDIDPDYKRVQYQAYGGGNYYNFTACTSVAKFPNYREKFNDIIESIHFNFPPKN